MNKVLMTTLAGVAVLASHGFALADEIKGGFCKVAESRFANLRTDMIQQILWEYTEPKLPEAPVMGYIDLGCADRGSPRAALQDLGKRIWFNVAGPVGQSVDKGTLSVSDSVTSSNQGDAGITANGMQIRAVVTPRHDCVYSVWVWAEDCASK